MSRPRRRTLLLVLAAFLVMTAAASARPGGALDRLERFRELAASKLALGDLADPDNPAETYREIYSLLDDEIVESLASGGVFASPEFLQDRLDAFGDAWGAAQFRLTRFGRLVVGAFRLTDSGGGNSVRVYGPLRGEAALLATLYREGRPSVTPLGGGGEPQFFVTWEGVPSGRGTRPLRVDLVHGSAEGVRVTWSTASLFPEGLNVRTWGVHAGEVRLRYELHYPGWTPGCEGQTEQEDVYRPAASGTLTRVSRRQYDAWHRELHAAVARLFEALAAADGATVAALVPDPALRTRLPALTPEPACDAADAGRDSVSIAATAADRRPWSLTFRRAGPRWRLVAAAPVLP